MDALKHLIANVPDWLKRLDELNGQIAQRQIDLAALAESQARGSAAANRNGSAPAPKSLRNKGSTESLRPHDEPEAHPRDPTPQPETADPATSGQPVSPSDPPSPSALARQTSQVRAAGQARARATLRKRQRTDSMVSAEGAAPKYRSRSMIIVYYDSYVQSFFEELVKFVSASRNMMRKAKMAAKVAQIKRLAELEMPDESDEEDTSANPEEKKDDGLATTITPIQPLSSTTGPLAASELVAAPLEASSDGAAEEFPALRYVSTRRMQAGGGLPSSYMAQAALGRGMYSRAGAGRLGGMYSRSGASSAGLGAAPNDVYDELDKGLEYVQSMCEHAAHQFLRDGDCGEEVGNIQRRLTDTKELADKEMDRVRKEEPELLKAAEEEMRGRKYQPQSMRKELKVPKEKDGGSSRNVKEAKPLPDKLEADNKIEPDKLEVDEGFEDMDTDFVPKLTYKSTRMMR